jgi:hypothetical protein
MEGIPTDSFVSLVDKLRVTVTTSTTYVIGSQLHINSTLSHSAALRALQPEDVLTPNLLLPLPLDVPLRLMHPQSYIGAALDDNLLPDSSASCKWLQTTTLQTIASGIIPEALTSVIGPWITRRRQSAISQAHPRRPRSPAAAAQQDIPEAHISPQRPIELIPPPVSPPPKGVVGGTRTNTATLVVGLVQCASRIWEKRNILSTTQHAALGLPPNHWRRNNPLRNHVPQPLIPAVRNDQPPLGLSRPRLASGDPADAQIAPIPLNPRPELPAERVHHPGRDPTDTEPPGCNDLPGP